MEETYIYTLTDPITNKVRYVGKANDIKIRYQAHMNSSRNHQTHKSNWISKLRKTGHRPSIDIIAILFQNLNGNIGKHIGYLK